MFLFKSTGCPLELARPKAFRQDPGVDVKSPLDICCISKPRSEMSRGKLPWSPAFMCFCSRVSVQKQGFNDSCKTSLPHPSALKYFHCVCFLFFFSGEELFLLVYELRLPIYARRDLRPSIRAGISA